jgi:hypothetical protein
MGVANTTARIEAESPAVNSLALMLSFTVFASYRQAIFRTNFRETKSPRTWPRAGSIKECQERVFSED